MPRLFPADKRDGEGFIVLMIYSRTYPCEFFFLLGCFSSRLFLASATAALVPVVRGCDHRNDFGDLSPPAFANSQMVQVVSLGILEPVVPIRSQRMPALSFLANFFFLIEDKGKSRTPRSCRAADTAFEAVIKNLFKRYLIDKIPLKEVLISDNTPFSVDSDSIDLFEITGE